jgi:hypothetical protein
MCDDPMHVCMQCIDRSKLAFTKGVDEYHPISSQHTAVRFGDRRVLTHHTLLLNGHTLQELHPFECMTGDNGWVLGFLLHGDKPGYREVHRIHSNDPSKGTPACIAWVFGRVEMMLKPDAARWLSTVEKVSGIMAEVERGYPSLTDEMFEIRTELYGDWRPDGERGTDP